MKPLHISFLVRSSRKRKDGTSPIYMRITVDEQRAELSTSRSIQPSRWDANADKVIGRKPEAKAINRYLDQLKQEVYNAQQELMMEDEEITAKSLKARITGEDKEQKTVQELFKDHNERVEELVGKDYAKETLKKYKTARNHTVNFIKSEFNTDQFPIRKVDHSFLEKFMHYLKTERDCSHNSAMKYLTNLKKITNIALKRGWLNQDPFRNFDHTYEQKDPVHLTQDELNRIENKELEINRLDRVRDVFVFSCYTGLGFSDAEKLTQSHIKEDNQGDYYLYLPRTKTDKNANVLLLPKAVEIIEKYKNDPETEKKLLPMISNQKTNAYLKEIANLCGIDKKLTHHVARHTCATTVLLANGVPIDTVQKVLGHANISSTKHYARVTPTKINNDMRSLRDQLLDNVST